MLLLSCKEILVWRTRVWGLGFWVLGFRFGGFGSRKMLGGLLIAPESIRL